MMLCVGTVAVLWSMDGKVWLGYGVRLILSLTLSRM